MMKDSDSPSKPKADGLIPIHLENMYSEDGQNAITFNVRAKIQLFSTDPWKYLPIDDMMDVKLLYDSYPTAIFARIVRKVALVLDEQYEDHIRKSKRIFLLDPITMKPREYKPETFKGNIDWKLFGAFRCISDLIIARAVWRNFEKEMKKLEKKKK